MAKTKNGTVAEAESGRELNRAERHERRDEIIERWQKRHLRRWFCKYVTNTHTPSATLEALFSCHEYGVSFSYLVQDFIETSGIPAENMAAVLLRLVWHKEMAYKDYLKTDHWRGVAAKAKTKYEGKCALSEDHDAVDAHHRTYKRLGRELETDVIPLCRECHERFHKR